MVAISKIMDTTNSNNNNNFNNNKNNNNPATALNNKQIDSAATTMNKSAVEKATTSTTTTSTPPPTTTTSANNSTTSSNAVALTASGKPKEKRRNNEKRKERSRDAARCRRSRETEIFTELAQVLPLKKEDVQQLDKASVMRIAIAYLKVRDMLKMFPKIQELLNDLQLSDNDNKLEDQETSAVAAGGAASDVSANNSSFDSHDSSTQSSQISEDSQQPQQQHLAIETNKTVAPLNNGPCPEDFSLMLKQTLDGFLLILSNDGDITYVTANISDYLGLSKIDILGQQIWEYAHQCDHAELKEALNIKRNGLTDKVKDENLLEEGISTDHRDLFVRLKCTITSRGRSINIKSASYKVIHITGHLVVNTKGDRVLVAMGRPIPHPSNIEVPLGSSTFLTKHSLDMRFTYVDDKMYNLLGYKPEDLLDTSLFNCHHGIDTESLMTTFKNVLSKGQGETCRYRFLGKYGGYCWIVTQATIVYDKLKPQSVVCVNFVISNLEKNNEIYTLQQYEESQKLKIEEIPPNNNNNINNNNKQNDEILSDKPQEEVKKEKIFNTPTEIQEKSLETTTKIITKVETATPPATPLNNNNNNNNKSINNKITEQTEDLINIKPIIKQEPPITTNTIINNKTPLTKISPTTATAPKVAATVPPSVTNSIAINSSILPLPPHCPTTTVTHTIFNKNKTNPPPASSSSSSSSSAGPKTVTSSLILTNLPTTTSTQSILQQHPTNLNVATRAPQSVTASVFSPLPPSTATAATTKLPSTTATAAILAQQTPQQQQQQQSGNANQQQDMNKGYLSFAEDATELTMLKEEPDDLTAHLVATNTVDACMPLDESGPLFGEILVGFGMGSYGIPFIDYINSLDSNTSSNEQNSNNNKNHNSNNSNNNQTTIKTTSVNTITCSSSASSPSSAPSSAASYHNISSPVASGVTTATNTHRQSSPTLITTTCATNSNTNTTTTTVNSTNIDPFINYRDESNDTNCSQHLLSPSVTSKSPEGSSLPSLCSPNSLSQEDEFSYYTMNVDDMDDLTMRAPYIPMNEQDDLPLLTSDDYMWSSGNAFTPDEFSLNTKDSDNLQSMQISQTMNYQQQQQQFTQQQQQTQQFSNSLCSSPASTVSSMSPSPIQQQQQQQQQQQNSQQIFSADSSELAALLCGTGSGALSILHDATNFTNSLNLNAGSATTLVNGNNGGNSNQNNNNNNNGENSIGGLTDDLDNVSVASSNTTTTTLDHHQQLQQQFQEQRQQLLSGLNIDCKKEKFETSNNSPSLTPHLCDSIEDTFDNVYNKNSTNLDCWNEFLQINENTNTTNNAATTTEQHQGMENLRQEQDCKPQLHMQVQQQQQQQTPNIIINAVPLITIQTTSNNKNVLIPTTLNNQQQQLTQQQQQHHQTQQQQQQQSNTKTLNKVNTIKLTPITSTATIKIIENKPTLMQQQQQQQQNIIKTAYIQATGSGSATLQNNNKRHLSNNQIANNALESKRLKSNIMDLQNSTTTSQLLQQLITTPQQGNMNNNNNNNKNSKGVLDSRWSTNENQSLTPQQQQQQQQQKQQQHKQSNSVLKNLLISGCDKTKLPKPEIITIDDGSRSSMQSPDLCLSPSLTRPLHCMTSPVAVLRNYRHNPWIGGPGVLPSPTASLITNEDSNPPGLMPCDTAIDSASDSGIDDISITAENMSPLKRTYEQQQKKQTIENNIYKMTAAKNIANANGNSNNNNNHKGYDNNKMLQIDNNIIKINNTNSFQENIKVNGLRGPLTTTTSTSAILMQDTEMAKKLQHQNNNNNNNNNIVNQLEVEEEEGATMSKRKRSISFLDSSNPLMTPFLMDLCNDDYHMNAKEYLQENDIENVLNDWPVDLV